MKFSPIDTNIIIVATNYLYGSVLDFENNNDFKEKLKKYEMRKITPNIISNAPIVPNEVMQQLIPVDEYYTKDNVKISYNDLEKRMSLFGDNTNSEYLLKLSETSYDFIDLKISDINAVGINFVSKYNLGSKKLKLLNNDIEKYIPDFPKNTAFQVTLMLEVDNYKSTYKIRKISGGDNTGEDRIYQIDTNMHFEIKAGNTQDKINYTKDILYNLESKYYQVFIEKCNQILEMNDES